MKLLDLFENTCRVGDYSQPCTLSVRNNYLTEVFGDLSTNSYPFAVDYETEEVALYVFMAKMTKYEVSFQRSHRSMITEYNIEFRPLSGPGMRTPWELVPQPDALKIFNTVGNATVDFVNRRDPDIVQFTAEQRQRSRVRLWRTMVKRMSNKLDMHYSIKEQGDQVVFKLIRSRP